MKWIKALLLAVALFWTPTFCLAQDAFPDDVGDDVSDDFDRPVPEPSGALVMGVALATAAVTLRRRAK